MEKHYPGTFASKPLSIALAATMVGCSLPMFIAANDGNSDCAQAVESTPLSSAVTISKTDFYFGNASVVDKYEGMWFKFEDADTICYKYQRNGSKMDMWVDGTGTVKDIAVNNQMCDWMVSQKGYKMHGCGTLYIAAGITRFDSPNGGSFMDVRFAKGSQLAYVGYEGLAGAKSVNLEVCTKLKEVDTYGLFDIKKTVTIPASVEKWGDCALQDTKYKLASPATTTLPPNAIAASKTADSVVVSTPKVKLKGNNKVAVSWAKPFRIKGFTPSDVYKKNPKTVSYSVRYKVQYRAKGDATWKKTGLVKSKSKTLSMLAKGTKYQIRVTAYKKSNGKWKAITTSGYKTTAAVKGYNPKPTLTATETTVKATWAKVPGASKYKVYWKAEDSKSWKSKTVKSRSCTVKGLASGKSVQVKVTAYKGKKGICKSTAAKATTKQAQVAPPAEQPETPAETPEQ